MKCSNIISIQRKFRSPTVWTVEKQSIQKSSQKKEDQHTQVTRKVQNVRKVPNRCAFSMVGGSECSARSAFSSQNGKHHILGPILKNGTALWRDMRSSIKMRKHLRVRPHFELQMWKNGTPLWCGARFQVQTFKTPQFRTTFWSADVEKSHAAVARSTFVSQNAQNTHVRTAFWSSDVEKSHAAVARSTFVSQNAQNTACSDHFLMFRRRKMARHCGAKPIFKSKCAKHMRFATLLDLPVWKRCRTEKIDRLILNQSIDQPQSVSQLVS